MAKKDEFELQALSTLRRPGDQVYSVTRTKKRNPLLEFLDVVVSGGAFTGAADVADSMATSLYLVAGRDRAVVQRGRVHLFGQLDPQDEATLRGGKACGGREVPGHRRPHGLDLPLVGPSQTAHVALVGA